jgi:low temperature requirement protein LtrA
VSFPEPARQHRLRRMTGRDPRENHRSATPLELLFDLTFVIAFAQAADQMARLLAGAHIVPALTGFAFVMFAICWAWINFSWFASAFDTDDWFFRVTTMVQMCGVIVLALGIAPVFRSIENAEPLDNGVLVVGYIIMRVAMIAQWVRVAVQDPTHRRVALGYIVTIAIAQVGWSALVVAAPQFEVLIACFVVLYAIEMAGPVLAERRDGGTPWHPHHIAERYGLLIIIALGEGILGTIAAVAALVEHVDWSVEAALVVVAGTGLTFGIWWTYFIVPSGEVLARHRQRSWVWGYGHIVIFAAIAAMGSGLHVAAYVIEGEATIGVLGAVLSSAIPVLVFTIAYFALYSFLVRSVDPFHVLLFVGTLAVLAAAVAMAVAGAGLGVCLLVVMAAPTVAIVGFEALGHRHMAAALDGSLD